MAFEIITKACMNFYVIRFKRKSVVVFEVGVVVVWVDVAGDVNYDGFYFHHINFLTFSVLN